MPMTGRNSKYGFCLWLLWPCGMPVAKVFLFMAYVHLSHPSTSYLSVGTKGVEWHTVHITVGHKSSPPENLSTLKLRTPISISTVDEVGV